MAKKENAAAVLAHKRDIKAAQMRRFRENRKAVYLDDQERAMIKRALRIAVEDGSLFGGAEPNDAEGRKIADLADRIRAKM